MDYYSDLWVGFLSGALMDKCINICLEQCNACKAELKLPILHLHNQLSLLEKFKAYLDEARGVLLVKINEIYDAVESKLPHSNDKVMDKEIYCNNARFYLLNATPESLFYGRHITEYNDCVIFNFLHPKPTVKRAAKTPTTKRPRKRVKVDLLKTLLDS